MKNTITIEEITREYTNKPGISGREAAKNIGVTYKTFVSYLKKYNIPKKIRESKYAELRDKEWLKKQYFNNKRSVRDIALEIGATVGAVHSAIRWMGFELRTSLDGLRNKFPNSRFGENSPRWKGGIRKTKAGYIRIYAPDHFHTTKEGYVMEHRLVMEKHLGRILSRKEIVHHINGKKDDNRIENLELVTDQATHTREHFERSHVTELAEKEAQRLRNLLIANGINPDENLDK